jgi:hypothetical protein
LRPAFSANCDWRKASPGGRIKGGDYSFRTGCGLGFEKGRQTADTRRSASVPVLLTSNLLLGALAGKAGLEFGGAHHGPLVSVPLPDSAHGAFEDLHGEGGVVGVEGGVILAHLAAADERA